MKLQHLTLLAALSGVVMIGCAAPSAFYRTQFISGGEPSLKGIAADQARLLVTVNRDLRAARGVQNVGGLTYDGADLTLQNASLLANDVTKTIAVSGNTANTVFTGLRPGAGYALTVKLKNGGSVVGNGHVSTFALTAGITNSVNIIIGQDGQLTVSTSTAGNALGSASAWTIAKGDTINLNTGFAAHEPSADYLRVMLDASLYGTPAVIAEVASGSFDTFSWNTGADATIGGYAYTASNLTTTGTQDGTITFQLLDASKTTVLGQTQLKHVNVVNGASFGLTLQ
ncbi:hypothetical protein D3C86_1256810 [compost metagenome]